MALPQDPNRRWSLDILSDQLSDGRRFRILAVVDDFTRECLAQVVDTSLSGLRVGREFNAIVSRRGRLLNEPHFASRADARVARAERMEDFNTVRPHSAIGNVPPKTYAQLSDPAMQRSIEERNRHAFEGVQGLTSLTTTRAARSWRGSSPTS